MEEKIINPPSLKPEIIVDAMGGDFAPDEIIKGAIQGKSDFGIDITLVGNESKIKASAEKCGLSLKGIRIADAVQDIGMDDAPSDVIKHKKSSSIFIGTELASKNKNSIFLSAGNTGAGMACSLINMRKIEGILRPAIATVIPLGSKRFLLLDAGANADIKPAYLKQFGIMGSIYFKEIFKTVKPRVGLLNVGSEEKKGNEASREGYKLLKEANINFIGNVEGRDIFNDAADVVVCDGFVGNILLKAFEGIAGFFFKEIKEVFYSNMLTKFSALFVKNNLKAMKQKFDYEEYGGALLLGIDGITIICHGSSKAKAIRNAIGVGVSSLKGDIVRKIKEEITILKARGGSSGKF
jgi:fatty acid/phospholipid synthesis protein PlsX